MSLNVPILAGGRFGCLVMSLVFALVGCSKPATQDPMDHVRAGWDFYRSAEFAWALREFESALSAAPAESKARAQALYGLALTWQLRNPGTDLDRGKSLFNQLLTECPRDELAPWAALALARIEHLRPVGQTPDPAAVAAAYQGVIDRYPEHPAADEAVLHQQAALLTGRDRASAERALARLRAFVDKHPASHWRGGALSLIALCYEILGEPQERLQAELAAFDAREMDASNPNADLTWAYWAIATQAEFDVGDFTVARRFYRKLIDEYPSDQKAYPAKLALARMDETERTLRGAQARGQR